MENCCTLLRGELYISDWSSACAGGLSDVFCNSTPSPYRKVGNITSAQVAITAPVLGKENKFNKSLDACSRVPIESVDLTLTVGCTNSNNLYQALFGEKLERDFGNNTRDFCIEELESGLFFPFSKAGADGNTINVYLLDANGDLVKELDIDIDFIFSSAGIELIRDIDKQTSTTLRLYYSFDTNGFHEIDFNSKVKGYKSLFFRGTNYNEGSNKSFDIEFHKVLFAPINQFDLLSGDEFLTLVLQGSVERDNGSWFTIIKEEQ